MGLALRGSRAMSTPRAEVYTRRPTFSAPPGPRCRRRAGPFCRGQADGRCAALDAEAASSRGRGMPYHEERPRFSAGDWSDRSGISAIMPAAAPPLLVSHPLLDSTDLEVVRAVTGRAWGKHASDVIGRDRYRLRLNRVEGVRLPVTFVDCSARIEARMEGIGCQFQVMVPLSGGIDMVIDGRPLSTSPGGAVFVRPAGRCASLPPRRAVSSSIFRMGCWTNGSSATGQRPLPFPAGCLPA